MPWITQNNCRAHTYVAIQKGANNSNSHGVDAPRRLAMVREFFSLSETHYIDRIYGLKKSELSCI